VPLLRFVIGRETTVASTDRGESLKLHPDIVPVTMTRLADREALVTLARQCRSGDSRPDAQHDHRPDRQQDRQQGGLFAPAGLLSELSGRPGRAVHAWLAWPIGPVAREAAESRREKCPLGFVALVVAGPAPRPRFSIAWLLVRPEARRHGIATALVARAVSHAWSLGAAQVFADTLSSWPAAAGFWRSVGFEQES